MGKLKRNERIGGLVRILAENPNRVFTLNYFTEIFDAAKSTISEDLAIVKKLMEDLYLGKVETITGASGGVKYIPYISPEEVYNILHGICHKLMDKNRIIPGGFLFMSDIIYNPNYVRTIGKIFASKFVDKNIDYVVTVETKGIPLALMTANSLNIPLVIIRNDNRVTEGATVSMNYISGSTGKIQNMYVSKRAIHSGANILIIDDFMKAGGTVRGVVDLMKEFDANIMGIGVLIASKYPERKLVNDYLPLILIEEVNYDKGIFLYPNKNLFNNN